MKELVKKVKFQESINAGKIHVTRDHYFANAYVIDIPLDSTPDHAWQDIFEREWKSSRRLWERKLFIMGDKLRLITTPNELEEKLTWIKQLIDQTNREIDEYNKMAPAEKQLKKQMAVPEEKVIVETVRDVLRKKLGASFTR
jgi:hypothetical protein